VAETATRLAITSLEPGRDYGVSLALGAAEVAPLDMAAAYGVFANHGIRAPATPVLRVTDAEGVLLEDNSIVRGEQVMNAAVADTVTDVMTGVVTSGTGTGASIGRPVAGKTGTAEDYRAAWFVGYTPQLSTAVWMGYSDAPRPLENIGGYGAVTGGSLPASVWSDFMAVAHEGLPELDFAVPGPLPAPGGSVGLTPGQRDYPNSPPLDCGGICVAPPTTDEDDSEDDDASEDADSGDESDDDADESDDSGSDDDTTTTTDASDDESEP
jgi:penicillin-binding protein 1A